MKGSVSEHDETASQLVGLYRSILTGREIGLGALKLSGGFGYPLKACWVYRIRRSCDVKLPNLTWYNESMKLRIQHLLIKGQLIIPWSMFISKI